MAEAPDRKGSDPFTSQAPAVSVVIPLYNKEATILRALDSVFRQTIQDFEVIVVNDGSTDGSRHALSAITDPRLRIIDQPNAGAAAARNCGIAEAASDLIAFLDADDEWSENHIETLLRLLRKWPHCGVVASSYWVGSEAGLLRRAILRGLPEHWEGELEDYFGLATRSEPPLWTSAVAVRASLIRTLGGFPEGIVSGEDLLTWARLAVHTRIAYCTEPTAIFWLAPSHRFETSPEVRRPIEITDNVGKGLSELCRSQMATPVKRALRKYLALWCRMRANALLLSGRRVAALQAAARGLLCDPAQAKLYPYLLLPFLPQALVFGLFRRHSAIRRAERSAAAGSAASLGL